MSRHASGQTIRTAFRNAAKWHHPDLNAGDPGAEEYFRQLLAAYEILKHPQRRADYDQYLAARDRNRRRERVGRFAAPAVAGVVSGSIVTLLVWLSVSLSHMQEGPGPQPSRVAVAKVSTAVSASADSDRRQAADGGRVGDPGTDAPNRLPEQHASSLHTIGGHPQPPAPLAREWEQVEASGGLMAIWAFAVRYPDAPESELAQSKLMALIDTAEDASVLHVLRLVATDAIAERAQERLTHLGVPAAAKAGSMVSDTPASLVPVSVDATDKSVNRDQPPAGNRRFVAKQRKAARRPPAAAQQSAVKHQRPDHRKLSSVEAAPCGAVVHGRCIGRDPDPSVRNMMRHDASMVND